MIHKYAIISDTHGTVHPKLHEVLPPVEAIFHGGDVCGEDVMMELRMHASIFAVRGNMDPPGDGTLPLQQVVEMPFGRVGITHGHLQEGTQESRVKSLVQMFGPRDVRLIIHGHTHLPYFQLTRDIYVVNPGSAGPPRLGSPCSFCLLEWDSERDLLRFDFQQFPWK